VANEADVPLWESGRAGETTPGPEWLRDERPPERPDEDLAGRGDAAAEVTEAPAERQAGEPERRRSEPEAPAAEEQPREVAFEDVVRGFEVDPGRFIRVTAEDLERFAPEQDRTVRIEDFVRLDEIDPVYFEKSYHVVPGRGGEKTYHLLVRAMEEAGYVAIGRFVLRTREHVAAIRPSNGALMLETLFRSDEVRNPSELGLRDAEEPSERELAIAVRLIETLATEWDPARYPDDYRERVLEMIRDKAGPAPDVLPSPASPNEEPAVFDLMEALKKSVEEARTARRAEEGSTERRPAPKRRRSG
jgi:DNA end-binding protein Ku